jgi:hypothetical protein
MSSPQVVALKHLAATAFSLDTPTDMSTTPGGSGPAAGERLADRPYNR